MDVHCVTRRFQNPPPPALFRLKVKEFCHSAVIKEIHKKTLIRGYKASPDPYERIRSAETRLLGSPCCEKSLTDNWQKLDNYPSYDHQKINHFDFRLMLDLSH